MASTSLKYWGETKGEGYVVRTSLAPFYDGWGYWSGYKKDPKFEKNIYAAKIYEDSTSAQKAIDKHKGQEFWDTACIIKVSFKEEPSSFSKEESYYGKENGRVPKKKNSGN